MCGVRAYLAKTGEHLPEMLHGVESDLGEEHGSRGKVMFAIKGNLMLLGYEEVKHLILINLQSPFSENKVATNR